MLYFLKKKNLSIFSTIFVHCCCTTDTWTMGVFQHDILVVKQFFFIKSCANAAFNNIVKIYVHSPRVTWMPDSSTLLSCAYGFCCPSRSHPSLSAALSILLIVHLDVGFRRELVGCCVCARVRTPCSPANEWKGIDDDNAWRNKPIYVYAVWI